MTIRVLIADAHTTVTHAYRDHLAALGYEVAIAQDGVARIGALRQFAPRVLVLGTSLTWGCSDGVLTVLDEEASFPRPIVIVLASDCEAGLLYRLATLHVDYFESMPITPRHLQIVIEEMLARSGAEALPAVGAAEPHHAHGGISTDRT